MPSTRFQLKDERCLAIEKANFRKCFSRRSTRMLDRGGDRVAIRQQVTSTRRLPVQPRFVGSSSMNSPSTNNSHSQTSFMASSHFQAPTIRSSQVQVPSISNSHFQTSPKDNSHDQTHLQTNIHTLTFSTGNPQAQIPLIDDPHDQSRLIDDLHDQSRLVGDPHDQSRLVDVPHDQSRLVGDPHDQSRLVDYPHDHCLVTDKSNYQNPTMNNQKEHASSPGNSQDQPISVSESLHHSSVSDFQNPALRVDDAAIVQTYKSGILQLRALRLQFGKGSPWSDNHGNISYHRHQRLTIASGELKSPLANVPLGKCLEEIAHLVKNRRKSRFLEDGVLYSTGDSYTPSLNRDRKYPLLAGSRHKCDTSNRLHKEDSRKQVEMFYPKELPVNTSKSATYLPATAQFKKRGCSDGYLTARKEKKRITDKKFCCQTLLNTSGRICEGHDSNMVTLLPRLRLSGLPHLADDSSCKTARNSVLLNGNNRLLQADSDKWGSSYGNFSSKWTNWKRWIGNTLALRQTRGGNPGDHSLVKGDYHRIIGDFKPGQGKLFDSGNGTDHGTDADSKWYRPRRDPPASPADMEDFLSPVTRVIITTTERHW